MKKILLIEDDQIVANIYRNKLSVEGYQVEVALDGEVGLEMVKSYRPDVVILDLMLPKLTGVELMKMIRAEKDFEKTPVIVFSNTYLTNMVQEAWKAGATKCLSKANCTPRQVLDVVRSTVGGGLPVAEQTTKTAAAPASGAESPPMVARPALPAKPVLSSGDADAEFQADLRKSFIESLPGTLAMLRANLQSLIKADSEMTRLKQLHELYRRIHALTGNAGIAGLLQISQMADALEALLKELYEKPTSINASTLRTVASAIDFLGFLFEHGTLPDRQEIPPANILVVDDEAISRRAVTYALEKAKLKSVTVEDPGVAYKLLSENSFDLVFLDVDMPGMNGFELCTKLRALPAHNKTPVVFVTSLTDFESRASSMMSGGNDFIAKPFLFIELAVKALVYVLRVKTEKSRKAVVMA
ncbi:MAG: response regulator [Verrucomicrobia bacterium]|nr:MAG: response regulator [Verrucomicrobiota bacterium]